MKISFNLEGVTFYIVLLLGIFNSVFRYYLLNTPFFPIVYISQLLMLIVVGIHFISFLNQVKVKRIFLVLAIMIFLALFVGVIYTKTILQVFMGVYILIPLFYGFVMYPFFERILNNKEFYTIILIIGILGVLLNVAFIFPWEGFKYEVYGKTIEGNRFWTSLGTRRLSGLGRSSFETAGYILFLGIMYILRNFKINLIWILAGIAIYFTDTKGILIAYVIISLLVVLWNYISDSSKKIALITILCINLALPLLSWSFSIDDITSVKFLRSFEMRLEGTWPEAYRLISESGNLLTGRGIGGIGVPQNIFEPELSHPGDNLFVYLIAIFGIGAFVIYGFLVRGVYNKEVTKTEIYKLFYILSMYVFGYGVTTNVIELPVMSICLGLVFRYWVDDKNYEIK
ncbi:hypothetical protein SAMN04487910_1082 [Aquimarina amphilecti]|uniref:O-antigen ligase like membrane protein n=1 Tax=Aquimarina amphilecti TaxID=1038014 RepID=A0A1H7JSL9_AQUAM|nr:hypothetical protein [Aquimarina amphilecti]SEK77316.1 hypothetical protein SAMN04487910_1082 [Aquimarina amphilecti]